MNNNTPLVDSLNRFVSDKYADLTQLIGKSLPASIESVDETGTIVTVNIEIKSTLQFPKVTCPVGTSEYVRLPLKPGDKGAVIAIDAYMGGMSGLGGGVATLVQQPNLSTLVWFPVGNKLFQTLQAQEIGKLLGYGDNGVILRSTNGQIVFELDKDRGLQITWNGVPLMTFAANGISIQYQGKGIVINSSGTFIDEVNFLPHEHTNVQTGSDNSGPVNT